jgi:DNA-binding Lrp family transcriptional regulator
MQIMDQASHTNELARTGSAVLAADALDFRLLNDFQRGFPLATHPWKVLAERLDCSATEVMARLACLQDAGKISRVGPVFAPNRIGASTLAAMAVPEAELPRVAAQVSAFPGVNHNYRREHRYNLWFVASAPDEASPGPSAGLTWGPSPPARPSPCPWSRNTTSTWAFDLASGRRTRHAVSPVQRQSLTRSEWQLIDLLHDGLPWVERPFQAMGDAAGLGEGRVLTTLSRWLADGTLRRFGVVVRHRELGWRANAMCVWQVPEAQVSAFGHALAAEDGVSLCYRRRTTPDWPYNLFCMIHGQGREAVEARRATLAAQVGLAAFPAAVLFSTDCYKQCGARYQAPLEQAA